MGKIFKLALRNLTRQKRRNVILAIAIAFGFFVVTTIDGLISGMVGNLEDCITELTGGTVLISGYEKIPATQEGEKSQLVNIIRDKDYIKNIVEENNFDYKYFSSFTLSAGQVIFNGKKSMATIYGRNILDKDFLDNLQIIEGSVDNLSDPQALIISDKMAESLNIQVGDQLIYTTTTIYGQNNVADFTIAAIIKSNNFINSMQSYANIDTINALVNIPEGGYNTFTIYLNDKNQQTKVAQQIENLIRADGVNVSSRLEALKTNPANPGRGIDKQFTKEEFQWEGTKYGVVSLNDEIPAIKTVLSVVHTVTTTILIVILLIVMVGVSNTYRMVLYERIREIGTMRALGMNGKDTGKIFTTEALILCLIGAISGLILSVIVMGCIHLIPINIESLSFFLHKGHFTFKLSFGSIIVQYFLLILLTFFAVKGSAKKAAAMSPAVALRTIK